MGKITLGEVPQRARRKSAAIEIALGQMTSKCLQFGCFRAAWASRSRNAVPGSAPSQIRRENDAIEIGQRHSDWSIFEGRLKSFERLSQRLVGALRPVMSCRFDTNPSTSRSLR